MKTRLLFSLLASTLISHAQTPGGSIYQENFNSPNKGIDYRNGAAIGGPGTGLSGKPEDRAYVAVPKSTEQVRNSPAALAIKPVAPDPLSAFTCTFWYYLDENGPGLQVPLNTASVLFLMHDKGFEIRIEDQLEQPRAYVFTPGLMGPYLDWREQGHWIFAAFTWEQKGNTFSVYQATPQKPVAFMRDMHGPVPAKPSLPRDNLDREPEVIGNTYRALDRPLAGRMDDLRFYDRVLTKADLETIRKADLANEPVK